jgi:hypothetical protein
LDKVALGQMSSWASIWLFTCIIQGGFCINPAVNLVSNIGFGVTATHTRDKNSQMDSQIIVPMKFPLIHPTSIERLTNLDEATAKIFFRQRHMLLRVLSKMYRVWKVVGRAYD